MTGGSTWPALGLVRIVPEQNADLEFNGSKRLGPHPLTASRGQNDHVAGLAPAMDGQGLGLGIDDPVVGDAALVVDVELLHAISIGPGRRKHLGHPVRTQPDR